MRKALITVLICWSAILVYSQKETNTSRVGLTTTLRIDNSTIIYNKATGERMKPATVQTLIANNPGITFENQINERGEIVALVYDPNRIHDGRKTRDTNDRVKPNEPLPEFIFNTLDDAEIDSKTLRGKIIVLSFHLFLKSPYVSDNFFASYDSIVRLSPVAGSVESIVITASSKSDCKKFLDQVKIHHPIVPDANIFMEKYIITNMPSFIVVNKDGTLKRYINTLVDLKKILDEYERD